MAGFRHLGDAEIAQLHRVTVVQAQFEAPDGSTFERDVIRDKRVVAMVPLLDDGRSVAARPPVPRPDRCRAAGDPRRASVTSRARTIRSSPPPASSPRRPASGPTRLDLLAKVHHSAGLSDELALIYLATGLTDVDHDRRASRRST